MPGSLILLLVVAPSLFAHTIRDGLVGIIICLVIGGYLLQEHIRASGGFRNSFTKTHGISNTLGIIVLSSELRTLRIGIWQGNFTEEANKFPTYCWVAICERIKELFFFTGFWYVAVMPLT
ncbi:hypothetical protein ACLOJK_041163 [Asimina triloba]